MSRAEPVRVHLVCGGFPPGSPAGHDMDYARLTLLQLLGEHGNVRASVANDLSDVAKWLRDCQLLVTYLAGPHLDDAQSEIVRAWLEAGGRWLGLHGTSGA